MAKKMPHVISRSGISLPESYWRVGKISIDLDAGLAEITFYCYKDEAARQAGKDFVDTKSYRMTGEEFYAQYLAHISGEKNIAEICYEKAMTTLDVPDPATIDPEDPNSVPQMKSFFTGAADIIEQAA